MVCSFRRSNCIDEEDSKKDECSFECSFIEFNTAGNRMIDHVPYKRLLSQVFTHKSASDITCQVTTCQTLEGLYKAVNQYFTNYLSQPHPITIVHSHSCFSASELRSSIVSLHELPVLSEQLTAEDMHIPNLTWRRDLGVQSIQSFYSSFDSFADRLNCARYAQIPLCNLATDLATQMCDVSFARLLEANKQVLWCSLSEEPDLGGHNLDSLLDEIQVHSSNSDSGVYRSYCFDVSLHNLCINAIKQCDYLQENMTGELVNADDGCGKAFEVLRLLITNWLQDITINKSNLANFLLMNTPRWLLNKKALLYNPAILRVVYRLMKLVHSSVNIIVCFYL